MKKIIFITLLILSNYSSISQTLDQDYYTSITADTSFEMNSTDNDDGQSFTCGLTGDLTSIKVVIKAEDVFNSCSPGDETVLQMELHAGDGFGGSVLGTSDNVTVLDGHNALTEFVFSTPIAITSGSMYTFEVNIISEDCSNLFINLDAVLNGTYANGTGYNAGLPHTSEVMFQTFVNSALSIEKNEGLDILVYPNPVKDFLYFKNIKGSKFIEIYNTLGQLIFNTNEKQIDFRNVNKGIYFLRIHAFKEKVTKKVIKY